MLFRVVRVRLSSTTSVPTMLEGYLVLGDRNGIVRRQRATYGGIVGPILPIIIGQLIDGAPRNINDVMNS